MSVWISLLRGVNVGAAHRIKMADLRAVYEGLGLRDVETYVQSGNVVFRSERAVAAARIEDAIEERFGFRSPVILRTPDEMKRAMARNPFPGVDGAKLLVWFLAGEPDEAARGKLALLDTPPEKMWLEGRELFVYFPNGMARPKLNLAAAGKALGVPGTGRNWNTVTKLVEMAQKL